MGLKEELYNEKWNSMKQLDRINLLSYMSYIGGLVNTWIIMGIAFFIGALIILDNLGSTMGPKILLIIFMEIVGISCFFKAFKFEAIKKREVEKFIKEKTK